ncbi:MAG: hypothetical protein ABIZ91_16310 [Gemmatimonadaceae bacterium]
MDVSLDWRKRARRWLLGAALGASVMACTEDLEGGAACPALCSGQNVTVFDTTFEAVTLDTTLLGIPAFGNEGALLLASRGDTLDIRSVVRFDSISPTFVKGGVDSVITRLDSAYLLLQVNATGTKVRAPVRIDLFDVDTTEADTSLAVVKTLFRPDRLIGGTTLDTNQVKDSIRVYFNNAALLAKISARKRLRVGIKATSTAGVEINLGAIDGGQSPFLRFDPAPEDTVIKAITVSPLSRTPVGQVQLAADFLDYIVVFKAPAPPTGPVLSTGGMPNRRIYLRFNIPSRILDSATVLRATLILTQQPRRAVDPRDSMSVYPQVVRAGEDLLDITRSAILTDPFAFDSIRVAPGDSGIRVIEMAAAVRQWAAVSGSSFKQQQAIILRTVRQGVSAFEVSFSSMEAQPALRPRLRVNYALRTSFGIP